MVGDLHGGLQHAAGVVAQVEDQPAEAAFVFLAQLGQGLADFFAGIDLELGDAQVAVAFLEDLALHALDLDRGAGQFHVERLAAAAHQGQDNLAAGLAAHLVHRLHQRYALGRLAVDLHDQVAGLDAGLGRRGVVDGRDHLDEAVLGADLDAQAAELAAGALLQLLEVFRFQVGRVRVEVAEHALDGVFQQGLVIHGFDVGGLDAVQHLGEGPQLVQRQRRLAVHRRGGKVCRLLGGQQLRGATEQRQCHGQVSEAGLMRHAN
ncbi:hypothetical protein D9M69_409860 [compost metagenome]